MAKKFNFGLNPIQPRDPERENADSLDTVSGLPSAGTLVQQLDRKETQKEKNPFDIKLIPRSRLRANKKNSYPIEEIDSLAASILEYGLQQNLVAIYSSEEDIYIIETGHRRTAALDMLIQKYAAFEDTSTPDYTLYQKNVSAYEKGYPCKVIYLEDGIEYDFDDSVDLSTVPESVIDSEIRLYITNEEVRSKNPARTAQAIARLRQLYDAKNTGKKRTEKINVNKKIAEDLKISDRQVAKYNSLDNLIPELRQLFNEQNITLSNADSYAKLPIETQTELYDLIKNSRQDTNAQVESLLKNNRLLSDKLNALQNAAKPDELELAYDALKAAAKKFIKKASKNSDLFSTPQEAAFLQSVQKVATLEISLDTNTSSFTAH